MASKQKRTAKPAPSPAVASKRSLKDPSLYIHRELSVLAFNERVLAQASNPEIPLLERLRFLTITSTNLDELFEIRLAGLREQMEAGAAQRGADGLTPAEALGEVSRKAHKLVAEQYRVLNEELHPALREAGVAVLRRSEWSAPQKKWIKRYFESQVIPVLTPIALDPAHPFPRPLNKILNFMVTLEGRDAFGRSCELATVQVPRSLPRIIRLPGTVASYDHSFVLLSSIIHANMGALFPGMKVTGCHQFRITRDSDLWVDEEEVDDLLKALKGELPNRNYGEAIRVEVANTCPDEVAEFLLAQFKLQPHDLYRVGGSVNLHRLYALYNLVDLPELKYPVHLPSVTASHKRGANPFDVLRRRDILLHHPYQSLAPVIDLVRKAAQDPKVLAIKQTLYRTGSTSPFVEALIEAARAGKEVTAVVELKARFDEAANIDLATRLQQAGVTVVYGIVGFKTHAKMLLIVRREGQQIRRYVHLGTGNYHAETARAYTDIGLLTADRDIAEDVHTLFSQLTGFGRAKSLNKLIQAPFHLHRKVIERIEWEAKAAEAGKPARIIAKMNSLVDPDVIRALYKASQAGVRVELIVRGICCLRPGVPGISDNITVRSIVGRFLEHSRIWYFQHGSSPVLLASSADWMPRNFFSRVEIAFPILEPEIARRVLDECLLTPLADNTCAWLLQSDGTWLRSEPGDEPAINAQEALRFQHED